MALDFDLDIDPETAEAAANKGGGGAFLQPGKHEVTLEKVLDATSNGGNTGSELWFRDGVGGLHKETLWNSKSEASKNRIGVLGERLGLLVKAGKAYKLAPGKKTLSDCVGVKVIIELFADKKDARQDGTPRTKLAWMGIHKLGENGAATPGELGAEFV